jgi:hypothetical protein
MDLSPDMFYFRVNRKIMNSYQRAMLHVPLSRHQAAEG